MNQPASRTTSATRQIARAAGTVMAAFLIGQLAGLLRDILVARAFGAGSAMDAFNAANRVAETLFTLVAGGALGSAFIPTFTQLLTRNETRAAWRLASALANLSLLVIGALSLLAAVLAGPLVRYLLAPGFASDPQQEALTVHLLRLMLPTAALFGLSGLVMGVLNARQVFFIPALTPAMYSLGIIFGALVLAPRMGIDGLAWGAVIGAGLHLGLQIPALLRQPGRYSLTLGLDMAPLRAVARLMAPRLLGVAVVQLNFWVNIRLASQQAEGSLAAISYAFRMMLMAQVAIAQSAATAAMPTFSAQAALGRRDEMRGALAATLRGVIFLSLPAALGLMILRRPLVAMLLERGAFDAQSTEMVAWALLWYAAGLVGHAMVEILARAFYALQDTKTPVAVGALAMLLNVALSVAFSALFAAWGWPAHGGLALALSFSTAVEAIVLGVMMRRRLGGLHGRTLLSGAARCALAGLAMALGLLGWLRWMDGRAAWWTALGGVLLGAVLYFIVAALLSTAEMRAAIGWLRQRRAKAG